MTDDYTEADAIQVREKFSPEALIARLEGLALREDEVALYLDLEAGAELGYARDVRNDYGIMLERAREGVLGELDALDMESDTYEADKARLEAKRDSLVERIKSSAMLVKLRAVPNVISESYERKAKEQLNFKGKVSEEQQGEINQVAFALRMADTIVSITDESGTYTVDYEAAKALRGHLPPGQFPRLALKINEVQFKDSIDESVVSSADF